MKKNKWLKVYILITVIILAVVMSIICLQSFAAGDVSGAVEGTWNSAQSQIKRVVNKVVFPVIDMILAVLFFVKVGTAYMDYRKHGQIEFAAPAILFVCLVFSLTSPLYIWQIIG